MQVEEITIPISTGNIRARAWGNKEDYPVIALHGWLDNAASFDYIAPLLKGYYIVAIDLPGHGLSDHRPKGVYFHIADYIGEILQVADKLEFGSFAFLGHSLGAAIACLIAGVEPHRVTHLSLIDALGPFSTKAEKIPHLIKKSLDEYNNLPNKKAPSYPSLKTAIRARLKATPMEQDSVTTLVTRSLKTVDNKYMWTNDKRLMLTPMVMLTENQVEVFLKNITCPVSLIRPNDGWPFGETLFKSRTSLVKNIEVHRIPGKHHVHMDDAKACADIFKPFMDKNS